MTEAAIQMLLSGDSIFLRVERKKQCEEIPIQLSCWNLEKNNITSRDTVGVKSCKCRNFPRREGSPSPQGGRWMMKGSFLAKNCWIGFLQLYSVQKQIVGSNLGLPATQTHKRMRGSIPWTHTIKCSHQLCSYSIWMVQRKLSE